jgi:hypothetical protein
VGEKELFELQTKQAKKRIKLRASDWKLPPLEYIRKTPPMQARITYNENRGENLITFDRFLFVKLNCNEFWMK